MEITTIYKTSDGKEFTNKADAEAYALGIETLQADVVETLSKLIVKLDVLGEPIVIRTSGDWDSQWQVLSQATEDLNPTDTYYDYHKGDYKESKKGEELQKIAPVVSVAQLQAIKAILQKIVNNSKLNGTLAENMLTDYYNSNKC